MKKILISVLVTGTLSIFLSSCFQIEKPLFEPVLEQHYLLPVAHGKIKGIELFRESIDLISIDPENATLSIKDNIELFSIASTEVVEITNGNLTLALHLNPIEVEDYSASYLISLGNLIENSNESGVVYTQDDLCDLAVPISSVIPPIQNTETNSYILSVPSITKVKYSSGLLNVNLNSNMDINLIGIKLNHYDSDNTTLLSSFGFTQNLDINSTLAEKFLLDDKLISGAGFFRLEFASDGSGANQVCVDTNQNILIDLSFEELAVDSGEFAFPDVEQNLTYSMKLNDIGPTNRLVKAEFSTGELIFEASSILDLEVNFDFQFNFAPQIDNKTFIISTSTSASYNDPLSGVVFNFSGLNGDKTNLAEGDINVNILASPKHILFDSREPSFQISNSLVNFKTKRLQGNFGKINRLGFDSKPMLNAEFYDRITNGNVNIKGGLAKFNIINTFGMEGDLNFDSRSINGQTGGSVTFDPSSFFIKSAGENPLVNNPDNLKNIDNSNSNIDAYFSNLPKRFDTDYSLNLSPNNDTLNTNQFIYAESKIEGILETNLPLNINFQDFTLFDTANFNINAVSDHGLYIYENFNQADLKDAFLNFETINKFPFDITITVSLLNSENEIIDTLIQNHLVNRAEVESNGFVQTAKSQTRIIQLTEGLRSNIFRSENLLLDIKLNQPSGVHSELRTDYFLDFAIIFDHSL
ncbi:MAG: hypothetical protein ACJATA_001693 [Sphingobacteriales bacterium]|jgi:hypothetical protein